MSLFGIIEEAHRAGVSSTTSGALDRLRGRGTLRDLVKHLRKQTLLPATFNDDLIALRNDVVHKSARLPTEYEVDAMLDAATSTAQIAWPTWPCIR